MTEPISRDPCRNELARLIYQALAALLGGQANDLKEDDIAGMITRPPNHNLGDFAFPCFRFAKQLGKRPDDVADELRKHLGLDTQKVIERAEKVGAFLNFFVSKQYLSEMLLPKIWSGDYFKILSLENQSVPTRIMIEFSQPNTHKEFHVGHLRNVVLGDVMCRLNRYCGFNVMGVNYPGDEGAHIAKCLWFFEAQKLTPPAAGKGRWLGEVYTAATKALGEAAPEEKAQYQSAISAILKGIEQKSGKYFDLWKETRQWSLDDFYRIYEQLDVQFDHYFFESEVSDESQKIVDKYFHKGLFIESDGAIGINLENYKLGFLILRKSDGNTLYATKDLALAGRKFDQYKIDRSIYVVGSEQNLHFRQVFKTLELMGFQQARNCFHLSYGMVRLPEGKMGSRLGNSVTYDSLREQIVAGLSEIMEKYREQWTNDELKEAIDRLAVGAMRYGMLNSDPVKEVIFVLQDWLSFDGNSGPYLMYSYARAQSIARKAGMKDPSVDVNLLKSLAAPVEFELLNQLYDFNDCVRNACLQVKPSLLTHFLFDLCRVFNRFYAELPVLNAPSEAEKTARLGLVSAYAAVLRTGLGLLGIKPLERM